MLDRVYVDYRVPPYEGEIYLSWLAFISRGKPYGAVVMDRVIT